MSLMMTHSLTQEECSCSHHQIHGEQPYDGIVKALLKVYKLHMHYIHLL